MRSVLLIALALIVAVHADCIGTGLSEAFTAAVGYSINFPASEVLNINKPPVCRNALPENADGTYQSCCALDAYAELRQFGDAFSTAISTIDTSYGPGTFDQVRKQLREHSSQIPAEYREFVDKILDALEKFIKNFRPHLRTCVTTYRDYLEGVICAACRPDFFPEIATRTDTVITFNWAPTTCSALVSSCSPVVEDLRTLIIDYLAAVSSIVPGSTFDGDFLAGVPGDTVADKIRTWLCDQRIDGVHSIDFLDIGALVGQIQASNPFEEFGKRLHNYAKKLADKRQGATTTLNTYTGNYDPVAVGQQNSFISSASSVTFSIVALAAVVIAVFAF